MGRRTGENRTLHGFVGFSNGSNWLIKSLGSIDPGKTAANCYDKHTKAGDKVRNYAAHEVLKTNNDRFESYVQHLSDIVDKTPGEVGDGDNHTNHSPPSPPACLFTSSLGSASSCPLIRGLLVPALALPDWEDADVPPALWPDAACVLQVVGRGTCLLFANWMYG